MTRTPIRLATATIALAALGLSACGGTNTTAGTQSAPRTVKIEMRDTSFSPNKINIRTGETVRFVFTNTGAITHDAFLGDAAAQKDHETEMRAMGGMGHGHDSMSDKDSVTLKPGKTGKITHTFTAGSRLLIGCHEEGHYAAGMRTTITMN